MYPVRWTKISIIARSFPAEKTYALQMGNDLHRGALKTGNWSYLVVKIVSRGEQIVKACGRLCDLFVVYDEIQTLIIIRKQITVNWVPRPFSIAFHYLRRPRSM